MPKKGVHVDKVPLNQKTRGPHCSLEFSKWVIVSLSIYCIEIVKLREGQDWGSGFKNWTNNIYVNPNRMLEYLKNV